jgi:NAD(P)-dependent dehydrogenase (short-subunit alcohol dehydrogenase family)
MSENSKDGENYSEEREAHELRGEIEETRSELSETIDAIQDKLNPEKVKEKIVQDVKDATVGRAQQLAETAKEKVGQLQEAAAPVLETAQEKVALAAQSAQDAVQNVSQTVSRKLHGEEIPASTNGQSSTRLASVDDGKSLKPISEQVVVVFGASSGIGRETAIQFARRGAKVVVAARGDEGLKTLVESIRNFGGQATWQKADVLDFDQVQSVADRAVAEYGRLDTWVHCAAVSIYAKFEDTTPQEFKQVIEVNLVGQAYGAMAALPHLKREGRGALIHISSVEARRSLPLQSAYTSSKHGIIGFLDALRMELAHEGIPISVTNVMPSGINTPLFNNARTKLGVKPMPAPPIYHPQVVAEVILYAAENPTRDIYAGGAGRMMASLQKLSPALLDKMLIKSAFKGQMTNEPKSADAPDNLFEPLQSHGRIGGDFHEQAKPKSLSNWLETHPQADRVLKGALLGGLAMWLIRRK